MMGEDEEIFRRSSISTREVERGLGCMREKERELVGIKEFKHLAYKWIDRIQGRDMSTILDFETLGPMRRGVIVAGNYCDPVFPLIEKTLVKHLNLVLITKFPKLVFFLFRSLSVSNQMRPHHH
ncbi:hypothetical protein HPP92_021492 [Vanilla planifolia]|uniref:Uncharacterized protein n=1 Tax=Vanilla planifolia TaxID=51239 RepID=A0A835UKS7_VANPL|nr:hypothetical protein HPP92_021855 [Vanilla planifolia]KAG0463016.1 hypothetical protein HPP92_021492 [Vanilla planifolia]